MGSREDLSAILHTLLGSDNVYFQQPPTTGMNYPCILYRLNDVKAHYADNVPYTHDKAYLITVMDNNPDSAIPDKISALPKSKFDRKYTAEQIHHFVYNVFF